MWDFKVTVVKHAYLRHRYAKCGDPNFAFMQVTGQDKNIQMLLAHTYIPLRDLKLSENDLQRNHFIIQNSQYDVHDVIAKVANKHDMESLCLNPNVTIHTIKQYPHLKWNFKTLLSSNVNFTYDVVMELYKLGFYGLDMLSLYSANPTLRYRIIKQHPEFPWDMAMVCGNQRVSTYHKIKHHEYFKVDLSGAVLDEDSEFTPLNDLIDMNYNLMYRHIRKLQPLTEGIDETQFELSYEDCAIFDIQELWNLDENNMDARDCVAYLSYIMVNYYENAAPDPKYPDFPLNAVVKIRDDFHLTKQEIVNRYNNVVQNYSGGPWPKVPFEFMIKHLEFNWQWEGILTRKGISIHTVIKNIEIFRDVPHLDCIVSTMADLTMKLVLANPNPVGWKWDYSALTTHNNITYRDIMDHPELPWNREFIICNPNMTVAQIRQHALLEPVPESANGQYENYLGHRGLWRRYMWRDIKARRKNFETHFMALDHPLISINVARIVQNYMGYI